jgi:hypothetical protein
VYTRVGQLGDNCSVAAALREQETFTREQVAWLMSNAMRWGYEARVDEESEAWPPPKLFFAGELICSAERQARRDEFDATARLPRTGDFKGRGAASPAGVQVAA